MVNNDDLKEMRSRVNMLKRRVHWVSGKLYEILTDIDALEDEVAERAHNAGVPKDGTSQGRHIGPTKAQINQLG